MTASQPALAISGRCKNLISDGANCGQVRGLAMATAAKPSDKNSQTIARKIVNAADRRSHCRYFILSYLDAFDLHIGRLFVKLFNRLSEAPVFSSNPPVI